MSERPSSLQSELAQARRDEEWALLVFLAWGALLVFILVVLLFSPVPWGAVVGLLVWALGVRGVVEDLSAAVRRTKELRARVDPPDQDASR